MGYYVAFFVLTDIRDARSEPIASFQSLNPKRGRKFQWFSTQLAGNAILFNA